MIYAVGCLNPYFSCAVFVKGFDRDRSWIMTSLADEGLADALLMPEAEARALLRRMPRYSFVIECSVADQERIRRMHQEMRLETPQ